MRFRFLTASVTLLTASLGMSQVTLNQVDTFQDGTTMDWSGGSSPTNIASGGPQGASDRYLQISATGGKLATYNITRWNGNYVSAGVTRIEADLKNLGTTDLVIRLVLFGPDTVSRWSSNSVVMLPANGAWAHVGFDLKESDFIRTLGTQTWSQTMVTMDRIMFRHEPVVSSGGSVTTGILGIDNVSAPTPLPTFDFVMNKTQVAGANFVQGTVSIPQTQNSPTVFTITDSTQLITTPPTATIATGQTLKNFSIQVQAVNFPVNTTVSAKLGSVTITRPLTLIALIPTALAFTPNPVTGGQSLNCRVVVNGIAGPGGRTIAIFDNSAFSTVPSSVVVPPGGTDVNFTITTIPVTSQKVVTVTARVTQGEKTATFRINP